MLLVVADTGPLRYLAEIGHIEILPELFEKIFIPTAVLAELRHASTPAAVRAWASMLPSWMEETPVAPDSSDPVLQNPDDGERAAIILGSSLHADIILIDDRKGAAAAVQKGFQVSGTLGLLIRAAGHGLIDLSDAFERLKKTNFRYRPEMLEALLRRHRPV